MAEPARSPPLIDVDTYLQGERIAKLRHEYVSGQVYAMGGASDAHNLIAGNLFAALHRHLRGGPCQVFMSDMKVRLRIADEDVFYYPDILVSCRADDRARYWREHPCLIVEIISPSTDRIDRREKLLAYREIAALDEYLLVEQEIPRFTLLRRAEDWAPVFLAQGDRLRLAAVGLDLPVMNLYEGIDLEGQREGGD